jgi:hypothetical protein
MQWPHRGKDWPNSVPKHSWVCSALIRSGPPPPPSVNDGSQKLVTSFDMLRNETLKIKSEVWGFSHADLMQFKCGRYNDWLRVGRQRGRSSFPGRGKICLFSALSRPVLGPNRLPIQLGTGGHSDRGAKLTTHLQLVTVVKTTWIYTSTRPYAFMAWCLKREALGQFYFHSNYVLIFCNLMTFIKL